MLEQAFDENDEKLTTNAVRLACQFYKVRTPKLEWYERLDWGRGAGECMAHGKKIKLLTPAAWRRGRKYKSRARWVRIALHELGHHVLWADEERKADLFAARWVRR